jgi:hypothetical protein
MPTLIDRPAAIAALSAGVISMLARALPYQSGLMLAALVGIGVGMILEPAK